MDWTRLMKCIPLWTKVMLILGLSFGAELHASDWSDAIYRSKKNGWPTEIETRTYKKVGDRELHIDIYRPAKQIKTPAPIHIYIHGGGWTGGTHKLGGSEWALFVEMAKRGHVGISVEYRLANEKIKMPTLAADCKDAIRYLYQHKDALGIDPSRSGVWGGSAGGHLASLIGLSSDPDFPGDPALGKYSSKVGCILNWYGRIDFTRDHGLYPDYDRWHKTVNELFGENNVWKRGHIARYSPVNYLSVNSPPMLIIMGEDDRLNHAQLMLNESNLKGRKVALITVTNGQHGWSPKDTHIIPNARQLTEISADYIASHTRNEKP